MNAGKGGASASPTAREEALAPYRSVAADWHGGQWTHLYGFASSGRIPAPYGLFSEIRDTLTDAEGQANTDEEFDSLHQLEDLRDVLRDIYPVEIEH